MEFEIFALFFNNINVTNGGTFVAYLDFSKVKTFTFEITAKNMGAYIRYKDSTGGTVNIWGTNYSEQGGTANVTGTYSITVNCEQYNFDVGYPVYISLSGSDGVQKLRITSYELI